MKNNQLFPIRELGSITGVNASTLRAWERRYGLLKPARTPKGHRLYTKEDVDILCKAIENCRKVFDLK